VDVVSVDDHKNDPDWLGIPDFLRTENQKSRSIPVMSKVVETEDDAVEVEPEEAAPAPKAKVRVKAKPVKAAKAPSNGHATPAKAKAKAAKPAKVKTKPRKPRVLDPSKLDQFGFRLGTIKAQAAAMYASKKGATLGEVKEKLESAQFNLLTEVAEKGFKVLRSESQGDSGRKVTRYTIVTK
jgi:hypothetical protein